MVAERSRRVAAILKMALELKEKDDEIIALGNVDKEDREYQNKMWDLEADASKLMDETERLKDLIWGTPPVEEKKDV